MIQPQTLLNVADNSGARKLMYESLEMHVYNPRLLKPGRDKHESQMYAKRLQFFQASPFTSPIKRDTFLLEHVSFAFLKGDTSLP
jgi:hypothetical protein